MRRDRELRAKLREINPEDLRFLSRISELSNIPIDRVAAFRDRLIQLGDAEISSLYEAYNEAESEGDVEGGTDIPDIVVPEQNPLFTFEIVDGKITLRDLSDNETDFEAISAVMGELMSSVEQLVNYYTKSPNRPQAGLFSPLLKDYRDSIGEDPHSIDFRVVYIRGSRIFAALRRADLAIAAKDPDWPSFDVSERIELDSVCEIHGHIIMASSVGRQIVARSNLFQHKPSEISEEREAIAALGAAVLSDRDLFESETAEIVEAVTAPTLGDGYPDRHRVLKFAITASLLTMFVGVPALAAGIAVGGGFLGIVAGAGVGFAANEVAKKTDAARRLVDRGANAFDVAERKAHSAAEKAFEVISKKMKKVLLKHLEIFDRIGSLRDEFHWTNKILDLLRRKNEEDT